MERIATITPGTGESACQVCAAHCAVLLSLYDTIRYDTIIITIRALGRAHLPLTKLFPRLAVNKTISKPRVAAATGAQYLYVGFSRHNKILRCSAYDIEESNPVPASGL